jgi:hypothetical protein
MPTSNEFTERVAWPHSVRAAPATSTAAPTTAAESASRRSVGAKIVMYQGSWSNGSLSADTHAGAGAADIGPTGKTTWRELENAGRCVGGACWFRPWPGNYHCHFLSIGNPALASWAKVQVNAYEAGYDGLGWNARTGRDTGTRLYANAGVTWEKYLAQHQLPDINQPAQEDTMQEKGFSRSKPQPLTPGDKYEWLQINDAGDSSWATGPAALSAVLNLRLSGLKVGQSAYVRVVEMAVTGGQAKRSKTYRLTEIPGTGGDTFASVPWIGQLAKDRRTRFEINTSAKGVTVRSAAVSYLKGALS